jgi:hypothetical protein
MMLINLFPFLPAKAICGLPEATYPCPLIGAFDRNIAATMRQPSRGRTFRTKQGYMFLMPNDPAVETNYIYLFIHCFLLEHSINRCLYDLCLGHLCGLAELLDLIKRNLWQSVTSWVLHSIIVFHIALQCNMTFVTIPVVLTGGTPELIEPAIQEITG